MCKRTELIGTALIALGAGLLLSVLFPSGVWTAVVGIGVVIVGFLLAKKR